MRSLDIQSRARNAKTIGCGTITHGSTDVVESGCGQTSARFGRAYTPCCRRRSGCQGHSVRRGGGIRRHLGVRIAGRHDRRLAAPENEEVASQSTVRLLSITGAFGLWHCAPGYSRVAAEWGSSFTTDPLACSVDAFPGKIQWAGVRQGGVERGAGNVTIAGIKRSLINGAGRDGE